MFDIASTEFLLVLLVALVVIGPKDLPKLLRFVGHWVAKARGVMAQFRSGIDDFVRESELKEMEEKWKQQNDHIMREFPSPPPADEPYADGDMMPGDSAEMSADQPSSQLPPQPPSAKAPRKRKPAKTAVKPV